MKKLITSLTVISSTLVLASCATIVSGTTETIHVQSIDSKTQQFVQGAHCILNDGKANTYVVNGNPGTAVVSRGNGAIQAKCMAPGYHQKAIGIGTSFNAWTLVNVLFWPGLIVDGLSGAYSKYPDHITVLMESNATSVVHATKPVVKSKPVPKSTTKNVNSAKAPVQA